MTTQTRSHSTHSENDIHWKEDIGIGLTAAAAAATADQLHKAYESRKHKVSHLLKAGLGAIVSLGSLSLAVKEHHKHEEEEGEHGLTSHVLATQRRHSSFSDYRPSLARVVREVFDNPRRVEMREEERYRHHHHDHQRSRSYSPRR